MCMSTLSKFTCMAVVHVWLLYMYGCCTQLVYILTDPTQTYSIFIRLMRQDCNCTVKLLVTVVPISIYIVYTGM